VLEQNEWYDVFSLSILSIILPSLDDWSEEDTKPAAQYEEGEVILDWYPESSKDLNLLKYVFSCVVIRLSFLGMTKFTYLRRILMDGGTENTKEFMVECQLDIFV
jgi:hypothetical protein